MEFPRLVFKTPGPHQRPGGTYDHALVHDQEDMANALEAGWFATLPEALEPAQEQDDAPPTRAELEAKAKELGVAFSPNIGDAKLLERINEAMKALEA